MDVIASTKERQEALRRATRVAKCIDVEDGIFRNCTTLGKPYQLCHLNNNCPYCKQYVKTLYQQICNCIVK